MNAGDVFDENKSHALLIDQLRQKVDDGVNPRSVKTGKGFVEKQNPGACSGGASNGDSLGLAKGNHVCRGFAATVESEADKRLCRPPIYFRFSPATKAGPEKHIEGVLREVF